MSEAESSGSIPAGSGGGMPSKAREIAESRPGTVVAKRFRIEELLNFGGMGALYRARDLEAQRSCALRVLPDAYTRDPAIMNRFMREARAATEIGHVNIIEVFDIGTLEDGSVYSAMELLDGQSLAEVLELEGRISPERAVHVATQVCRALGTAHESSIIHRDLKPENIVLIAHEGDLDFVKVVDFGIYKYGDEGGSRSSPEIILGAPDYIAPEQAANPEANPASDIYALGCILFEMLTGRVPYLGRNAIDVLMKKGASDAPRVTEYAPDVPEAIADVVAECLSRRPEDRPESMRALELDLMRAIDPASAQSIRSRKVAAAEAGHAEVSAATSGSGAAASDSPIARAVRAASSGSSAAVAEPSTTTPAERSGQTTPPPGERSAAREPSGLEEPMLDETGSSGGKLLGILVLGAAAVAVVLYVLKPELYAGLIGGETQGESVGVSVTADARDSDEQATGGAPEVAETGVVEVDSGAGPETNDVVMIIARADLAITEGHWREPAGNCLYDYLAQIEKLDPGNEAIARLKDDALKAMEPAGEKALEEKRFHDAVETYRALLDLAPDPEDRKKKVLRPFIDALLNEGRLLKSLGKPEDMLANADEALALSNNKSFDAQLVRAEALEILNRWPEAVEAYKAALKLRKSSREVKKALADAKKKVRSGGKG